MRVAAHITLIGFVTAVIASETVRALLLLFMLLVGGAGFLKFLLKTRPRRLGLGGIFGSRGGD